MKVYTYKDRIVKLVNENGKRFDDSELIYVDDSELVVYSQEKLGMLIKSLKGKNTMFHEGKLHLLLDEVF